MYNVVRKYNIHIQMLFFMIFFLDLSHTVEVMRPWNLGYSTDGRRKVSLVTDFSSTD